MASYEQYAAAISAVNAGHGTHSDYEMTRRIANTLHHDLRREAQAALERDQNKK